jgi:hypothetical protein
MILQRCPRCWRGRIFRAGIDMNDPCPECGLLFQREEGYFLGAMYVSYGLSVVLIGAAYLAVIAIFPKLNPLLLILLTLVLYAPFVPAVFRYSRVLWIYFDRAISPTDASAGTFEKQRLAEYAREADRASKPPAT